MCLIVGFLVGRTTIRRSLKWCKKHLEELREYLPLKNGIASPSTACRILSRLDEELFALEFMEWIGEIVSTEGIHISIDGKALRASMEKVKDFRAPMVLNAIEYGGAAETARHKGKHGHNRCHRDADTDHGADPVTGGPFCTDGQEKPAAVL